MHSLSICQSAPTDAYMGCRSYSPQLFITLGTGQSAALAATIVTGVVNHVATYVSLWAADEFGRRLLFLEAGVQVSHLPLQLAPQSASTSAQCYPAAAGLCCSANVHGQ